MCPALTWIRSDRLAVAQRAVANPALGWRLRVELGGAQSLRSDRSKRNTIDVVGQSPLPGVVPSRTAYVDAHGRLPDHSDGFKGATGNSVSRPGFLVSMGTPVFGSILYR
jgi:hypothetical protein